MFDDEILAECVHTSYHLRFEGTPVAQERARVGRGGHFFIPKKSSDYKKNLVLQAKSQFKDPPIEGAIFVEVTFRFIRARSNKSVYCTKRPDIDNCQKIIFDALNGVVWKDDSQIVYAIVGKRWDAEEGVDLNVFCLR